MAMSIHRDLERADIVGQKLREIRQSGETNQDGLDWAESFFCLDSGVVFSLPLESANSLCAEELPPDAEPIMHPHLSHILGQRIADVLRPPEDVHFESLCLLMENGHLVCDVVGAPRGTGGAGVFIYSPGEIDMAKFRSIWETT
jgi:hypothetical protein